MSASVVGSTMKTWLYRGISDELISVALCKVSVGGDVARILRFIALASIFCRVPCTVSSMFLPNSIPRCLMLSGVVKPLSWKSSTSASGVFMHNAEDFLRLC